MPRKGQITPKPPIGDVRDPNSLYHHMQRFGVWQQEKNYAAATIAGREAYIRYFIVWCDERGLGRPQDVTKPILERYQRSLFLHRKENGHPLSARSQHMYVTPLRAFFKWLARQNQILYNPASDLDLPRLEKRLPRHILTVTEVETVLAMPDLDTAVIVTPPKGLEVGYVPIVTRQEPKEGEVEGQK